MQSLYMSSCALLSRTMERKCWFSLKILQNHNTFDLLSKYSSSHLVLNDGIQGTASVVLDGLISAQNLLGKSMADHTFLILGAGEAGTGITEPIALKISKEGGDLDKGNFCFGSNQQSTAIFALSRPIISQVPSFSILSYFSNRPLAYNRFQFLLLEGKTLKD